MNGVDLTELLRRVIKLVHKHIKKETASLTTFAVPDDMLDILELLENSFEFIHMTDSHYLYRQPGVGDIDLHLADGIGTFELRLRKVLPPELQLELDKQLEIWRGPEFSDSLLSLSPRSFIIEYITQQQSGPHNELFRIHRELVWDYLNKELHKEESSETMSTAITLHKTEDKDGKYLQTDKGLADNDDVVKALEASGFAVYGKQKRAQLWWIARPEEDKGIATLVKTLKKAGVEATLEEPPVAKKRGRPTKDDEAKDDEAKAEAAPEPEVETKEPEVETKAVESKVESAAAEPEVVEPEAKPIEKANGEVIRLSRDTSGKEDFLFTTNDPEDLKDILGVLEAAGFSHFEKDYKKAPKADYWWIQTPENVGVLMTQLQELGTAPELEGFAAGKAAKEILQTLFDAAGVKAHIKGKLSDPTAEMNGVTVAVQESGFFSVAIKTEINTATTNIDAVAEFLRVASGL